jgi:molybdopterin-guanine dinucleotide biosynthesis protein A
MIKVLTSKGYRVAGVRHSPHNHSTDTPGADTKKFRDAGAFGSGLISANETDLFIPSTGWQEKAAIVRNAFSGCHLILMEGGIKNGREKIEVVPEKEKPVCSGDVTLRAIVSAEFCSKEVACFAPCDIEHICAFVEDRYLKSSISAAILAGGRSTRLGHNKALLKIKGGTVIERVINAASQFISAVRIITNSPDEYKHLGFDIATDIRPGCGPLSGIHSALIHSATEYVLVLSCDIPLVSPEHLRPLINEYPGADITIYKHKKFEPLCAIYRRTCIDALEELIDHGEYRIIDLFPSLNVKVIRIDHKETFRSINTEDDYKYILKRLDL